MCTFCCCCFFFRFSLFYTTRYTWNRRDYEFLQVIDNIIWMRAFKPRPEYRQAFVERERERSSANFCTKFCLFIVHWLTLNKEKTDYDDGDSYRRIFCFLTKVSVLAPRVKHSCTHQVSNLGGIFVKHRRWLRGPLDSQCNVNNCSWFRSFFFISKGFRNS